MAILSTYTDDTATTDDDKFLTSDATGATKLTSASTLKGYVLASGNVGTDELADSSVTNAKLGLTITTDANGWQVINLGNVEIATKKITFSQTISTTGTTVTLSSNNLPVGLTNVGTAKSMVYSTNATGFSYALNCMYEGAQTATALNFTARSSDSTRAYDGTISVTFVF